jgi:hypothetical protein
MPGSPGTPGGGGWGAGGTGAVDENCGIGCLHWPHTVAVSGLLPPQLGQNTDVPPYQTPHFGVFARLHLLLLEKRVLIYTTDSIE